MQRLPPYSEEAERGVLGSCLLDSGRCIDLCVDKGIRPSDFYVPAHRIVYETILEMNQRGAAVDLLTATERIQAIGKLEQIGGATALDRLCDSTPTVAHCNYYVEIVRDKALLRAVISCAREIETGAYDMEAGETAEGLRSQAEFMFSTLAERTLRDMMTTQEAIKSILEACERAKTNKCAGIPTGFDVIDVFLGGLMESGAYWFSGQKGCGKTTLARNICENLAMRATPIPSHIFSIEQTSPLVWGAVIAREAKQSYNHMLNGRMRVNWDAVMSAAAKVSQFAITVDDRMQTLSSLRSRIVQARKKFGIKLAVIDYIQRIRPEKQYKTDEQKISDYSTTITEMAKEFKMPIIGISSLSRENNLRGSGQLDYDAWGHLRLEAEKETDDDGNLRVTIHLEKQRFGPPFSPRQMLLKGGEGCFADMPRGMDATAPGGDFAGPAPSTPNWRDDIDNDSL